MAYELGRETSWDAAHFGDSDADIPAGTNVTFVRQWNEIRKEKELAVLQFEELKEELGLSKLRVEKLGEIEARALQRLNALEQNLSEKRDLLESVQYECRSIEVKLHDTIEEAEQYCAEIEHQDAVISELKEYVSRYRSIDYAQSFIVNEVLVGDLQGEVTCLQEVNEALHAAHSEGMKLFELFKELELQLGQTSHEISSCATVGYSILTMLHPCRTLADELAGVGKVHTMEVAIDVSLLILGSLIILS
ncbi:hypothetical protein EDD18DRAFT_1107513 [Armillaria luteobubalina]|uniref:Uncharacterized protein n=1 Tax=Armillaria luteobubalina TaxID=153913 RepID=A0AA39Q0P7_9AGAR|nr:hypothetical protein EDD18DRAFT_1107513 [Armillaria luteobubalina]